MLKRCKAYVSIETILTTIPLLLMLVFYIHYSSFYSTRITELVYRQNLFNALVSIADYIVKTQAVVKENEAGIKKVAYPNWIKELDVDEEKLKKKAGLKKLHIGFEKGEGECIYRIIVYGEEKEIRKLYVCGE